MSGPRPGAQPPRSLAMISSIAFSIPNFRGPLVSALVASGLRVYALAPDYDEKTRAAVRALGAEPVDIAMERTGMRPGVDLLNACRLYLLIRRLRPDLTFAYFVKPVIYGSLAAALARVPRRFAMVAGLGYAFTPDGSRESVKRKALRATVSFLYRIALRTCERAFFQNGDDVAQFVRLGLIDPAKVVEVRGSGVDLERLAFVPPVEGPPRFLLMARLLREKGICEYIAAARIVRQRYPETRFVLLGGTDPNPGGLGNEEVAAWTKEGVIEWHGHVDDVRPWIAQSSVYVLPSYREGKPRSTQEAMAMGRAVITTDAPGCRDTVDEGINGFLVPVRDVNALAAAMLRFVENPGLIASMGRESRRLAEERFDVVKINAVILDAMGIGCNATDAPDGASITAIASAPIGR